MQQVLNVGILPLEDHSQEPGRLTETLHRAAQGIAELQKAGRFLAPLIVGPKDETSISPCAQHLAERVWGATWGTKSFLTSAVPGYAPHTWETTVVPLVEALQDGDLLLTALLAEGTRMENLTTEIIVIVHPWGFLGSPVGTITERALHLEMFAAAFCD